MHKLVRDVRFSVSPFLPEQEVDKNSLVSLYFELSVGLVGRVNASTGFVVNVTDIDKQVHEHIVPLFNQQIGQCFRQGKSFDFADIGKLLCSSNEKLSDKFKPAMLSELSLKLDPFRAVSIDCEDLKMIYFSEKFDFAATHKLWNDEFSEEKNFEVFGKCANPSGHGHNYVIEVTVKAPTNDKGTNLTDIKKTVLSEFINLVDHKNLNVDVAEFSRKNPTVENIAVFAWNKLKDKFKNATLHSVTISETDKTRCTYYG